MKTVKLTHACKPVASRFYAEMNLVDRRLQRSQRRELS
jgi:hypothetical protein